MHLFNRNLIAKRAEIPNKDLVIEKSNKNRYKKQ